MPASLNFKKADRQTNATTLAEIKTIIYEDNTGKKYTFGVDNATNVFNTFKYDPNGAAEVDYSATATKFMIGGAIATLLDIGTNVDAIKTKTDNMPDNLVTKLGTLAKTAKLAPLVAPLAKSADAAALKAKTDIMHTDLKAELIKLTAIGNAISGNGNVTEAAKTVLENSFKKAIEKAGENGSDWLENRVADIVSQPKFDIPASGDAALNWTW